MERGGVTRQFSEEWLADRVANAELVKLRRGDIPGAPPHPVPVPVAAAPALPPLTVVRPPKAERDALPDPLESDVQRDVLSALDAHPAVAWVARMNVDRRGTTAKSGFKGMADILGQLRDGRFLAVEVKRRWTNPEQAQIEFLGRVSRAGGVAFVARGGRDVWLALGDGKEAA